MSSDPHLDDFAEEFSRQVRSGQMPSPEKIIEEFPELSEEMLGFVETLSLLEEAGFQHRTRGPSPSFADASGQRWARVGGFRLIREINRGGMGIVYEAEQEALQRRVAIKVLPSNPMRSETQLSRFKREGMAIARLHHSHIVPVFGTGEQNGVHYCVMQYIEGCSLDRLIRLLRREFSFSEDDRDPSIDMASHDSSGSECSSLEAMRGLLLDEDSSTEASHDKNADPIVNVAKEQRRRPRAFWTNVARIGADMADALCHAHGQGVLHRDVKPGNLLMDKSGHVWLADFGVAKLLDHDNLTATDGLVGTLRYVPPEQFEGESDARSDIYSLGLTLYELCALQPAFTATDRRELMRQVSESTPTRLSLLMPDIPADLETVICKAMSPIPADRYQKASDLAADFRAFLTDRPVTARRLTVFQKSRRWCRRHRTETALGAVIALLLVSYGLTASVAYVRETRLRKQSQHTAKTAISAINQVYEAYVPDWTTSSTVSAHGSISVSPATARLLEGLLTFYDEIAEGNGSTAGAENADVLEVTSALRRVALIYHRLGMLNESKEAYGKALARLSSLANENAGTRFHLEYARVSNELGAVYWTDRQIAEAYEVHLASLEILQRLDDPTLPGLHQEILFERARTEYLLGRRARGRQGGVPLRPVITKHQEQFDREFRPTSTRERNIRNAVTILEKLVEQTSSTPEASHLLALCYCEMTDVIVVQEELKNAPISRAIALLEELGREFPRQPAYRYSLCKTLLWPNLTKYSGEADFQSAAERAERALAIAEKLAQERPDEWIYPAVQVEAHLLMEQVRTRLGLFDQAQSNRTRAIDVGDQLVKKYPSCLSFRYWVGVVHQIDGISLENRGEAESALKSYSNAMKHFTKVIQREPAWGHVVLRDLKTSSGGRARVLQTIGRHEESAIAYRETGAYDLQLQDSLATTD